MSVTSQKWFKDQIRLYGLLLELSKGALEELEYIRKTDGWKDILLDDKEVARRIAEIQEVRGIFNELDKEYTGCP